MDGIHNGLLNSISVVCNTDFFEESIQKLEIVKKDIRLCLHLNLVEGKPVSSETAVNKIIGENAEFKYSFLTLWLKYVVSSNTEKLRLKEQVKLEIENQIKKYKSVFDADYPIRIDSHMHFHMIPFVFDCILELSEKYKIQYIRIPYELKYVSYSTLSNWFSMNLVKNILDNVS